MGSINDISRFQGVSGLFLGEGLKAQFDISIVQSEAKGYEWDRLMFLEV